MEKNQENASVIKEDVSRRYFDNFVKCGKSKHRCPNVNISGYCPRPNLNLHIYATEDLLQYVLTCDFCGFNSGVRSDISIEVDMAEYMGAYGATE